MVESRKDTDDRLGLQDFGRRVVNLRSNDVRSEQTLPLEEPKVGT